MKELIKKIQKVMQEHNSELPKFVDELKDKTAAAKKEIRRLQTADYTAELAETYRLSLADLEDVYESWASVQRKTKGLTFTMDGYIRTLKPRQIPKGNVEDFVGMLVNECQEAMAGVAASRSVDGDIKPQKAFCQALVDFRNVTKNAAKLIEESGSPERQRKADIDEQKRIVDDCANKLEAVQKDYVGLKCRKDILALKDELDELSANATSTCLDGSIQNDVTAHRFLTGVLQESVPQEIVNYAASLCPDSAKLFSGNGVYFDMRNNDSIIINAPKKFFETDDCYDLFTKLFFSVVSQQPASNVLLCGMEKTSEQILFALSAKVQRELGKNSIFGSEIASGKRGFQIVVESLMDKYRERSGVYRASDDVQDWMSFNEKAPDNPQPLILCIVNNYPVGFDGADRDMAETMADFEDTLMAKGPQKGIVVVLCQDSNPDSYENKKRYEGTEDTLVINIDGKNATINDKPASLNVTSNDFSASEFWRKLKSNDATSDVIDLKDFLKKAEQTRKNVPPFYEKLVIPIGKSGGKQFDMSIKTSSTQGFGLLLGASDSGKSTLLHTFILSTAYFYSPDEVQFYLADFKDSKNSPEFSNYVQSNGVNMFIPHVRYLSLKSKKEMAVDLLNRIEVEISNRSKMMSKLKPSASNITVYNKSEAVRSGKLPKIPVAIFIIDEANAMLSKDVKSDDAAMRMLVDAIAKKLGGIFQRARAYGIEVFLSGQRRVGAIDDSLPQINTRIMLTMKDDSKSNIDELYSSVKKERKDESIALELGMKKGSILYTNDAGLSSTFARVAFGGESGQAEHLEITEAIRKKYAACASSKFMQTVAGSTAAFPITQIDECEDGTYLFDDDVEGLSEEEVAVKYEEMEKRKESETAYYLPIGASSATTLKISLAYSQKENAANYVAFAGENKLYYIERNVVNAAAIKKGASVVYGSTLADQKKFISPYGSVKAKIEQKVEFISDKTEIARKILRLEKLYIKRKKQLEREDVTFEPVYLVLHKIEWLTPTDKDIDWVPSLKKAAPPPPTKTLSKEDSQKLENAGIKSGSKVGALLANFKKPPEKPIEKSEESSEEFAVFSKDEVVSALSTLYAKGNRCAIFVLMCSTTWKPISYFRDQVDGSTVDNYGVYGSFDEYNNRTAEDGGATNCAYVTPSNASVRLIDYSPAKYSKWWENVK